MYFAAFSGSRAAMGAAILARAPGARERRRDASFHVRRGGPFIVEEIKRALGKSVFLKDITEGGKKGVQVGEGLRIFDDKGVYTLSFLKGTDEKTRRTFRERLELSKVQF